MESTSCVLSFRMVFFYLVTTGWIFYISLYDNPINQSIKVCMKTKMGLSYSELSCFSVSSDPWSCFALESSGRVGLYHNRVFAKDPARVWF